MKYLNFALISSNGISSVAEKSVSAAAARRWRGSVYSLYARARGGSENNGVVSYQETATCSTYYSYSCLLKAKWRRKHSKQALASWRMAHVTFSAGVNMFYIYVNA